jgi:heme exporter protein B
LFNHIENNFSSHADLSLRGFLIVIQHEILTTFRKSHSWLTPLLFFIIVVCLFPLALGPDNELLNKIAPAIIWVAALLAVVMSIATIFSDDADHGCLDLLLLSPRSLTLLVLCKTISHWLSHCLPLIILTPLLGLLLHLNFHTQLVLIVTLLLGTPVLSMLGAIGAGLTVGVRQQGLLLPVLIMPLYIPVLIFGTGSVMATATMQPVNGYFAILGALALFSLAFAPWLTGMALRVGVNQ